MSRVGIESELTDRELSPVPTGEPWAGREPGRVVSVDIARTMRAVRLDDEMDRLIDRARRRFPPHLETAPTPHPFAFSPQWWGWHRIAWWPTEAVVPSHCYWRRYEPPHYGEETMRHKVWDDAT